MIETPSQHEKREKAESATRKSLADRYAQKVNGTSEQGPITKSEAEALTRRIVNSAENLGQLLLEAHRREAWKALGYNSWREYATARFKFSKSHAYRLMDHAETLEVICPIGQNGNSPIGEKPPIEAVLRPLGKLPVNLRQEAWGDAVHEAKNGKPTARDVNKVVRRLLPLLRRPTRIETSGRKSVRILNEFKATWKKEMGRLWKALSLEERAGFITWLEAQ